MPNYQIPHSPNFHTIWWISIDRIKYFFFNTEIILLHLDVTILINKDQNEAVEIESILRQCFYYVSNSNYEYWADLYVSRKEKSSIRYIWKNVRYTIYHQTLVLRFRSNYDYNCIEILSSQFRILDNVNIIIDDTIPHQGPDTASIKSQHLPRAFKCCQNNYSFNFDTKSCTIPRALSRLQKVRYIYIKNSDLNKV